MRDVSRNSRARGDTVEGQPSGPGGLASGPEDVVTGVDCGAATLEARQTALAERWADVAASWFAVMGRYAAELTEADRRRVGRLEERIKAAIVAGDEARALGLMREWQSATVPLRWLPHGRAFEGGAWFDSQVATYHSEAALRGVPGTELCPGDGSCGGACTTEGACES